MSRTQDLDDTTRAVIERPEMVLLLQGGHGVSASETRERGTPIWTNCARRSGTRSTGRCSTRCIRSCAKSRGITEHVELAKEATRDGRVIYVLNHKSHADYLVEPLVLDDNGIRPPLIAAGINLFGGPLGLLHRHITGAIPIRRNTKDPVYLNTLKAYVAEMLRHHDLLFYLEGGRSYSGELKSPKTGLLHAAMGAGLPGVAIVPMAVAYDLVLEDRALASQGVKKRQRAFTREMAEMVGLAVGYRSRAFVTFGEPIPLDGYHHESRREVLDLAHHMRNVIGRLHKVLPTALVASAMRQSLGRRDLELRVEEMVGRLKESGATGGA